MSKVTDFYPSRKILDKIKKNPDLAGTNKNFFTQETR